MSTLDLQQPRLLVLLVKHMVKREALRSWGLVSFC